ncbi:MAG: hypothetical protein ABSD70_14835 [Terracidiphilus sp.]|jgi:hypothetical protein
MRQGREQETKSKHVARVCELALPSEHRSTAVVGNLLALAVAITGLGATTLAAQGAAATAPGMTAPPASAQKVSSPTTSPSTTQKVPSANHKNKLVSSHAAVAAVQPAPQPVAVLPAVPPPPDWPANDQPSDAMVSWDSHGLRVVAANSSLEQILKAISTQTGATLEGLNKDERVFGIYGPGQARDVISQLLDGSGYNVLMIGDAGQGTPRQIVLTARTAGNAQPGAPATARREDEDNEAEEAQQPEPPQEQPVPVQAAPTQPGAVPVRTPQQMMQEMQQRQPQQQQPPQ